MSHANIIPIYLLARGARPGPCEPIAIDDVKTSRLMSCEAYGGCLNFAVHCQWRSFHCVRCPVFAQAQAARTCENSALHFAPPAANGLAAVVPLKG